MNRFRPSLGSIPSTFESVIDYMRSVALDGALAVSTIGPEGTSADFACRALSSSLPEDVSLSVGFAHDFDIAMAEVLAGRSDLVLVPSAYRDVTAFHWHADLEMVGCFVYRTPSYGLATHDGGSGENELVLATMSEVQSLFSELAPEAVRARLNRVVVARSTSHAASLVRQGQATMSVCNELGADRNGLRWFQQRDGVPMVWMLFARREVRWAPQ